MHHFQSRLLFVCVGNACRSPMAEAIARHCLDDRWEVASAGTAAAGWISPEVVAVLEEIAIPSDGLRSKSLTEVGPDSYGTVIILSSAAPSAVVSPSYGGRVLQWPLPDPVGLPITAYREVRDALLQKIPELARVPTPTASR